MRMRKKPNLQPRMEKAGAVLLTQPEELCGAWRENFKEYKEIHLELGCGKGGFTVATAESEPSVMLVAIERVPDAMVVGMEKAVDRGVNNVRFMDRDVSLLGEIFKQGEVDRIYVNFCDPWPKSRDAKHRLTSPNFLRSYASLLPVGGEIHFKTDNRPLFDWSVEQMREEGWELSELTNDRHANGPTGIMTDYERKFHTLGIKINRVVARRTESTRTTADGTVLRLRNASLVDARGYAESKAANEGKDQ